MITQGIEFAVEQVLASTWYDGQKADENRGTDVLESKKQEVLGLIRAEAINLADRIIGKDKLLHGTQKQLNPIDKAVFDFQVKQRVELAKYQNDYKQQGKVTGPEEVLNPDLSENEG